LSSLESTAENNQLADTLAVSGDFSRELDKTSDIFALNIIMSDSSVERVNYILTMLSMYKIYANGSVCFIAIPENARNCHGDV
jgi:hypothetical protein